MVRMGEYVVLDTTKVQIFKQITTTSPQERVSSVLFQIPQRYRFSSKSQRNSLTSPMQRGCFRYHKGTDFQANHNMSLYSSCTSLLFQIPQRYRFSSKSQHKGDIVEYPRGCFRYHKGTDFQANHNEVPSGLCLWKLFQIPQRYRFSSKSQLESDEAVKCGGCFRYHKGTDFQANHNAYLQTVKHTLVVLDTTKVQIFKQITTHYSLEFKNLQLFQIPQRYRFSSKSQHLSN